MVKDSTACRPPHSIRLSCMLHMLGKPSGHLCCTSWSERCISVWREAGRFIFTIYSRIVVFFRVGTTLYHTLLFGTFVRPGARRRLDMASRSGATSTFLNPRDPNMNRRRLDRRPAILLTLIRRAFFMRSMQKQRLTTRSRLMVYTQLLMGLHLIQMMTVTTWRNASVQGRLTFWDVA